jgi:hypothetical protein
MRLPSSGGWRIAVNSVGVPPPQGTNRWRGTIRTRRARLTDEERADPTWEPTGNDAWWADYFHAQNETEMYNTTADERPAEHLEHGGAPPFLGRSSAHPRACHRGHLERRSKAGDDAVAATISFARSTLAPEGDVLVIFELSFVGVDTIGVFVVPHHTLHRA